LSNKTIDLKGIIDEALEKKITCVRFDIKEKTEHWVKMIQ
jgi:hypothetical protein